MKRTYKGASASTWASFWRVSVTSAEAWLKYCVAAQNIDPPPWLKAIHDSTDLDVAKAKKALAAAKRLAAKWEAKAEAEEREREQAEFERLLPSGTG